MSACVQQRACLHAVNGKENAIQTCMRAAAESTWELHACACMRLFTHAHARRADHHFTSLTHPRCRLHAPRQAMSNLMWALAKLGYYPEQRPELIKGVLEHASKAPLSFRPQEMCNLLWALTQHRCGPGSCHCRHWLVVAGCGISCWMWNKLTLLVRL